jgi:hypothetical protein
MSAEPSQDNVDDLWGPFREELTRRINRDRPTRYSRADQSWMEPTIAYARAHLPADDVTVIRKVARDEVIRIEKDANRKANTLIKRYALGQAPLFWGDLGPLPFTIDLKTGLRVRFDAATPEDFELRAARIRDDAKVRHEAEIAVAAEMERLARQARERGYERVAMLGDLPLRADGRIADLDWDDEDDDDE